MKNAFSIIVLLSLLFFIGCEKESSSFQPHIVNSDLVSALERSSCIACLCKAPNGATLPCSELPNWEDYTHDYIPGLDPDDTAIPEAVRWKYLTQDCPSTPTGQPQIKCIKKRNGDCREAFDCLECANCDI